ncbi:UrcA family protein [Sphingomonas sp. DT-207]|uniref:UrcA family protein n=1 Tax=Sphingomonas sp. DT-207 TaxID=3396167 RepID=UPI003F1CF464
MKSISIVLGAGLGAAIIIGAASAQVTDPRIVAEIGVRYDDLDLDSDAGARAMLARLDVAATKACGGKPFGVMSRDHVGVAKEREYRRCKAAAMEGSTLELGSPRVRAAWLEKQSPEVAKPAQSLGVGAR